MLIFLLYYFATPSLPLRVCYDYPIVTQSNIVVVRSQSFIQLNDVICGLAVFFSAKALFPYDILVRITQHQYDSNNVFSV